MTAEVHQLRLQLYEVVTALDTLGEAVNGLTDDPQIWTDYREAMSRDDQAQVAEYLARVTIMAGQLREHFLQVKYRFQGG
jgi:hypothetical protein